LYYESGRKVYKDGVSHLRLYNIDFGKDVTDQHYLKVTLPIITSEGVDFETYVNKAAEMVFRYYSVDKK
jgi:hypothetical protein